MGIGYQATRLLCNYFKDNHILKDNAKCIMLGRLTMGPISQNQKKIINIAYPKVKLDYLSGYAENFIRNIGFDTVDSLDLTDFEGANKLYNLSIPLSGQNASSIEERYDAVFDFGTSEHIFSIASSLKNSLFMLKKGGVMIMSLPMTGFTDHGFFQMSPCFYYALNNDILELDRLYFYHLTDKKTKILAYDGMHKDFKRHIDGSYDGSFLANVLSHSGKKFNSFAVFRKKTNGLLDDAEVIQPIYKAMTTRNMPEDYIPGCQLPFKLRVYRFLHKIIPEVVFSKIVRLSYKKSRLIFSE
jgi:hypothetical protein